MTDNRTPQQPLPRHRLPYGQSPYITSKEYWAFRRENGDLTPAKVMIPEAAARVMGKELTEENVVTAIEETLAAAMSQPVKFQGLAVYVGQMTEAGVVRLINAVRKAALTGDPTVTDDPATDTDGE